MGRISPELALVDPDLRELLLELLPDPGDCLTRAPAVPLREADVATRSRAATAERIEAPARRQPVEDPRPPVVRREAPRGRRARRSLGRRLALVAVLALLAMPWLAFVTVTDYPELGSEAPRGAAVASPAVAQPETTPRNDRTGSEKRSDEKASPGKAQTRARTPAPSGKRTAPKSEATAPKRTGTAPKRTATPPKSTATAPKRKATAPKRKTTPTSKATPPTSGLGAAKRSPKRVAAEIRWPARPEALYYSLILVRQGERVDFRARTNTVELHSQGVEPTVVYHWFVYPAFGSGREPQYGGLVADGTVKLVPGTIRLG